jgi:hypothetical protein
VQTIEIVLAMTVPVQLSGPLKVIFPSLVSIPMKPSKGAANESEQAVSVTTAFIPTRDESQCAVTVHVPDTSGHAALPPSGEVAPSDDELELQAAPGRTKTRSAARRVLTIRPS